MNPYLQIAIAGWLGIITHTLIVMVTINKATPGVDFWGVFKQYWKSDGISFILSIVVMIAFAILIGEWVNIKKLDTPDFSESIPERLLHFRAAATIKTISYFVGLTADYLIYKAFGKAKKVIDKKLDDEK